MRMIHVIALVWIIALGAFGNPDPGYSTATVFPKLGLDRQCVRDAILNGLRSRGFRIIRDEPLMVEARIPASGVIAYLNRAFGREIERRLVIEFGERRVFANSAHYGLDDQFEFIQPARLTPVFERIMSEAETRCF